MTWEDTIRIGCANAQEQQQAYQEIEHLRRALSLACTPPFKTGGVPSVEDQTLVGFFLRRAAKKARD